MIVDWLMAAVEAVLTWVGSLFPVYNGNPLDGWGGVLGHLADLNYYLPIAEVFTFTIGVFVVFPALAGVSLVAWLVAMIRGGSSRG